MKNMIIVRLKPFEKPGITLESINTLEGKTLLEINQSNRIFFDNVIKVHF